MKTEKLKNSATFFFLTQMHPTVFHMEISIIIQILTHNDHNHRLYYDMVLLTLRYSTFLQHTEQELSQYVFTQPPRTPYPDHPEW